MNGCRLDIVMLAALAAGCAPATAATRQANPATVKAVMAKAQGGDVIVLAPGDYENVLLVRREFKPSLVIDAKRATLVNWQFNSVSGVTIRDGAFRLPPRTSVPPNRLDNRAGLRLDKVVNITVTGAQFKGTTDEGGFGEGDGMKVVNGANLEVSDSQFSELRNGAVFARVDGVRVLRNTFERMRSDGIALGESRNGLVEGNSCRGTRPRDKEHPDCVQIWSRPTSPPTADIIIRKNKVEGNTQGFNGFNVVRNGVDDGGFDRITIEDNEVNVSHPQGVALTNGRNSIVRNNRVSTLPGARWRASINFKSEGLRCGNVVAPGAGKPGVTDKRCEPDSGR